MNSVQLIGRLTRDPEIRYTESGMAICTFNLAIDRPPRQDGTRETDFPRITVFGRQAENCAKYLSKGRQCGVEGRIQTGSYTNKNGDKVYTTDVVANRVEFIGSRSEGGSYQGGQQGGYQGGGYQGGGYQSGGAQPQGGAQQPQQTQQSQQSEGQSAPPEFTEIPDDEIPF
ncbi:MAG: single-stranded DNA-binding protein [Anaerovoracaceae bacterium]|jgi:single-strand DNA-binding protein